jgi:hypothetical protein
MKKLLGLVWANGAGAARAFFWSVLTDALIGGRGRGGRLGDIIDGMLRPRGGRRMLFVEQPGGGVRISFRSRGGIHVGRFARRMSPTGGGHPRAAGCVLPGRLETVIPAIREALDREMREAGLLT